MMRGVAVLLALCGTQAASHETDFRRLFADHKGGIEVLSGDSAPRIDQIRLGDVLVRRTHLADGTFRYWVNDQSGVPSPLCSLDMRLATWTVLRSCEFAVPAADMATLETSITQILGYYAVNIYPPAPAEEVIEEHFVPDERLFVHLPARCQSTQETSLAILKTLVSPDALQDLSRSLASPRLPAANNC